MIRPSLFVLLMLACSATSAAPVPCASAAIEQAGKLLSFHTGDDARGSVASKARRLPPLANPVDRSQKLTVLEVTGFVYKAEYRMRLIYFPMGDECVLLGQEILELARP